MPGGSYPRSCLLLRVADSINTQGMLLWLPLIVVSCIDVYCVWKYIIVTLLWLSGYIKDGKEVKSFDGFKQVLGANFELVDAVDLPFVYRYNARMFLCCVDHATVWRRRKQPDV